MSAKPVIFVCIRSFSSLALTLLLTSCAHTIYINHNAFANIKEIPTGFSPLSSFAVKPISQKDTMLNQEIADKIEHILSHHGYSIKDDLHADYYLLFDYHMNRAERTIHVGKYIPGQTITSYGSSIHHGKAKFYTNETETPGTYAYIPETHVVFTKSITITVYARQEYIDSKNAHALWQETAVSCDENDDLRDSIDYLLITAFKYFGKNTQKNLKTTISSNDKDVSSLRAAVFNQ